MNLTPYEHLDKNELYISIEIVLAYTLAFLLPRKLKREITFLLYMWGFTVAKTLDFSIGGGLFDFYDVCDSPHYDVFDFVSYFLYAPFSYIFIYFYERLKIKGKATAFYIIAWSIVALGFEWLSLIIHMITYKNGYTMLISFPIYLFVQSATIVFYRWIKDKA